MATIKFHEHLPTISQIKGLLIKEAIERSHGNLNQAADSLGITKQTILKYIQQETINGRQTKTSL